MESYFINIILVCSVCFTWYYTPRCFQLPWFCSYSHVFTGLFFYLFYCFDCFGDLFYGVIWSTDMFYCSNIDQVQIQIYIQIYETNKWPLCCILAAPPAHMATEWYCRLKAQQESGNKSAPKRCIWLYIVADGAAVGSGLVQTQAKHSAFMSPLRISQL